MISKEMIEKMDNFQIAILAMIDDNGYLEALCCDKMSSDQRDRFSKIKSVYLDECLKDIGF